MGDGSWKMGVGRWELEVWLRGSRRIRRALGLLPDFVCPGLPRQKQNQDVSA